MHSQQYSTALEQEAHQCFCHSLFFSPPKCYWESPQSEWGDWLLLITQLYTFVVNSEPLPLSPQPLAWVHVMWRQYCVVVNWCMQILFHNTRVPHPHICASEKHRYWNWLKTFVAVRLFKQVPHLIEIILNLCFFFVCVCVCVCVFCF